MIVTAAHDTEDQHQQPGTREGEKRVRNHGIEDRHHPPPEDDLRWWGIQLDRCSAARHRIFHLLQIELGRLRGHRDCRHERGYAQHIRPMRMGTQRGEECRRTKECIADPLRQRGWRNVTVGGRRTKRIWHGSHRGNSVLIAT